MDTMPRSITVFDSVGVPATRIELIVMVLVRIRFDIVAVNGVESITLVE